MTRLVKTGTRPVTSTKYMIDLNNLEEIKKLDPKNVFGSTGMLSSQCEQIWNDGKLLSFPPHYKSVKNIIIAGMGGSAYGGHVVSSLFRNTLKVPLVVYSDYGLPAFTNEDSLVILESYSGSTEEPLSAFDEAQKTGAKITGLTSGGLLGKFLKSNSYPSLIFDAKYNPSGQPRLAPGYMVIGTIAILNQLGLLNLSDQDIVNAISRLVTQKEKIMEHAREIANKLQDYIPVVFAAEHLLGNAHIIRNQFNETSKSFSAFEDIPELNHHLLEGLKNPSGKKMKMLFIESSLYSQKIQKRVELTRDVVSKNQVEYARYEPTGDTPLSQMLEVLSFGGYLTVYLALLYGQDPSVVPWVDYFKQQLAK